MDTKQTISIIQKGDEVKIAFINKQESAKDYVKVNNTISKKQTCQVTHVDVIGDIVTGEGKDNKVSVITKNGQVFKVYLNKVDESESFYNELQKVKKDGITYKLKHTQYIEMEE